jgi:hypothetical protein
MIFLFELPAHSINQTAGQNYFDLASAKRMDNFNAFSACLIIEHQSIPLLKRFMQIIYRENISLINFCVIISIAES